MRMSKTEQNLLEAFAGESQANRRYLAFAKKADKEGYPQAARLFRAAAEAETVHALAHLRTLGKVRSTAENLKEAIAGEIHEFTKMYPAMIEVANEEKNKAAARSFSYANKLEKVHAALYQKALKTWRLQKRPTITYAPYVATHVKATHQESALCAVLCQKHSLK